MGTSPVTNSAQLSGAAKDDAVGLLGDNTFTVADLLANDPGGANKLADHFFFGNITDYADTAIYGANAVVGGVPTQAAQITYLGLHGITANAAFTEFTIGVGGTDIEYMVQIGNKGTWSVADVDVTPKETLVVEWTFENHTQANGDEVSTPEGFWNLNEWAADHPQYYEQADDPEADAFASSFQIHGEDGHRALDTAASPGDIFLQAAPIERDGKLVEGGTMPDLVDGQQYHATVSVLRQDYSLSPDVIAGWEGTDPDAWVEFNFNSKTITVHASDIAVGNEFVTFDVMFEGVAGEDFFTIMSHGTGDDNQGLLIDSIQIHQVNDFIV